MSNLSPCLDRYVNRYVIQPSSQQPMPSYFQMHQYPSPSPTFGPMPNNSMFGYPNGWTGIPLISTVSRKPRKYNNNNNSLQALCEYDESAMSKLAIHAQGAPLIFSGRYKGKHFKKGSSVHQSKENSLNYKNNKVPQTTDDKIFNINSHGFDTSCMTNESCLPRIIKPRKRRKKDRKPPLSHHDPSTSTTSLSTTSNGLSNIISNGSQDFNNMLQYNNNSNRSYDFIHKSLAITTPTKNNFYSPIKMYGHELLLNDSTPISLSNSSLSSSTASSITNITSSCSCRLCDPFCKIWAFPLRRSCSDNSADLELYTGELVQGKKDVGVIGGNRTLQPHKTNWTNSKSMNTKELNNLYQQSSKKNNVSHIERLRHESLSDSGDSGCDLLSCLTVSEDTLANVNNLELKHSIAHLDPNDLMSENLYDISKQLSNITLLEFNDHVKSNNNENLSLSISSDRSSVFSDNSITSDGNNKLKQFLSFDPINLLNVNKFTLDHSQLLISPILVDNKQNPISCILNSASDKEIDVQESIHFDLDEDFSKEMYDSNDISIWKNRLLLNLENCPKLEAET